MTKVPDTADFMPPEALTSSPKYGTPMDVFSFAGIVLHMFNQSWPTPEEERKYDAVNRKMIALLETERCQKHLDKMTGPGEALKPLVEQCLDCDPALRPKITTVCKKIQVTKDSCLSNPIMTLVKEKECTKEKASSVEKLGSVIKSKDMEITKLTQQIKELNKELEGRIFETEQIIKEKCSSKEKLELIITEKEAKISELTKELASVSEQY